MNYYKHLSKQQQQAIIHCYESGKSTDGVGEQFGCSRSTVCNILKKFGIPARSASHYTTCTRRTALTQDNKDLIDGLLLSDASISKRINNRTSKFTLTSVCEEFVDKVASLLPFDFSRNSRKGRDSYIEGRLIHCKTAHTISSPCDLMFNDLRDLWYPNGVKIVPKTLVLSPIVVKYWFYGDGYATSKYHKRHDKDSIHLGLCTDSFSKEDCLRLCRLLKEASGADFHCVKYRSKHNRLMCYRVRDINLFYDYIGECDVASYSYKWKRPSSSLRSDNTSGIRGVSWHKRVKKWCATIYLNGKVMHIGSFHTKNEAIEARKTFEQTLCNHQVSGSERFNL